MDLSSVTGVPFLCRGRFLLEDFPSIAWKNLQVAPVLLEAERLLQWLDQASLCASNITLLLTPSAFLYFLLFPSVGLFLNSSQTFLLVCTTSLHFSSHQAFPVISFPRKFDILKVVLAAGSGKTKH